MIWPQKNADHLMVTSEQMGKLESQILSSGFPVPALMEKVGQSMASWLLSQSCLLANGVVVLVGPGHNGGDGLVVARELFLAGISVSIWCPFSISRALTKEHLSHVNWLGIKQLKREPDVEDKALWIDAIFGLGQSRPMPELLANLFQERHRKRPGGLVSLDVPSGICSDTGQPFAGGGAVASFTLTVGLIKQGLVQDLALAYVGQLIRIDIGFKSKLLDLLPEKLLLRVLSSDLNTLRWPQPSLSASKYQRGRVLILAGSDEYRGAAFLALRGAISSGAGSIQALIPNVVADSLWEVAPEVVVSGTFSKETTENFWEECLSVKDLGRLDSILIGPGLGLSENNWNVAFKILKAFNGLLVLDADGLNQLAASSESWKWIKERAGPTWITPHLDEFRRLFPSIQSSFPLDAAIEASQLTGAGVLLKGAHSVIADPSGITWQLVHTAPWAARAGFGDLLAGFVAGAGALGMTSKRKLSCEVLAASAFLHAEAARICDKGSSPSAIADSLASLTKAIQSKSVRMDT